MNDDLISVIDVATRHGKHKGTIHKILKRLGIQPQMLRNASGQKAAYISLDDFQRVTIELRPISKPSKPGDDEVEIEGDSVAAEEGVFYLVQLEPELDPKRFKVGFATSMSERLGALRCSAPFASVINTWPCRPLWEKTAIECVSFGCERLHTETFRAISLEEVSAKCDRFFALMPPAQPSEPNQVLKQIAHAISGPSEIKGSKLESTRG